MKGPVAGNFAHFSRKSNSGMSEPEIPRASPQIESAKDEPSGSRSAGGNESATTGGANHKNEIFAVPIYDRETAAFFIGVR